MNNTATTWRPRGWSDDLYRNQQHSTTQLPRLTISTNTLSENRHVDEHAPEGQSAGWQRNESPVGIDEHSHSRPQVQLQQHRQPSGARAPAAAIRPQASSSTYNLNQHGSPQLSGDRGSQQVRGHSPHRAVVAPWHRLPPDYHRTEPGASDQRMTDAPLTLEIPKREHNAFDDIPRVSPGPTLASRDGLSIAVGQSATTPHPTSLPSFASFRENASRSDESDEVEIAPMSSRLPCHLCMKLNTMISEIAFRAAELDENIQMHCNKSVPRTLDFPKDSPVRAAEWILSRLAQSKSDLCRFAERKRGDFDDRRSSGAFVGEYSMQPSSPNLKRPAEQWDDPTSSKRNRHTPSTDERQPVRDRQDHTVGYLAKSGSPPPPTMDSVPGSAYPRTVSPGPFSHRQSRALPSPASMICPPSAAPSLTLPASSPTTAHYQSSLTNSTGTNSATSAHIADLQHQISLKSLALQTLQSEYSSLLQKLQRERVKSQIIETKSSAADREVNELSAKNEDLTAQVRTLQKQLEESERKRGDVHAEAKREKDQWSRMLDMSSRLQNKHAEDKQKLAEENARLVQRLAAVEEMEKMLSEHNGIARQPANIERTTRTDTPGDTVAGNDPYALGHENGQLKARIHVLRIALENAKAHHEDLIERMHVQSGKIETLLTEAFHHEHEELGAGIVLPNPSHRRVLSADSARLARSPRSSNNRSPPQHSTAGQQEFNNRLPAIGPLTSSPKDQAKIKSERTTSSGPFGGANLSPPYSESHTTVARVDGSPTSYRSSPGTFVEGTTSTPQSSHHGAPESIASAHHGSTTSHGNSNNNNNNNKPSSTMSLLGVPSIFGTSTPYLPRAYGMSRHHVDPPCDRWGMNAMAMPPPPRPV